MTPNSGNLCLAERKSPIDCHVDRGGYDKFCGKSMPTKARFLIKGMDKKNLLTRTRTRSVFRVLLRKSGGADYCERAGSRR